MGMVMGVVREEMPKHSVLHKAATYEVRKYGPSVIAECGFGAGGWGAENTRSPFGSLARYIGVFGTPQNVQQGSAPEPIAMTAPVLVTPKPSVEHKMAFVLPASKYAKMGEAPKPTDPRVSLRELPERVQAVRTFTWNFGPEAAQANLDALLSDLQKDGWSVVRDKDGTVEWQAAGYNPPFALPFMKRNEVLVSVREKR